MALLTSVVVTTQHVIENVLKKRPTMARQLDFKTYKVCPVVYRISETYSPTVTAACLI